VGQAYRFSSGAGMAILASLRTLALYLVSFLAFIPAFCDRAEGQQTLGSITGRVRVVRGDTPPERVLVSLNLHQTPLDSVYTDSQGIFGFHSLQPEGYEVTIDDDQYQPVRIAAVIHPSSLSPTVILDIQLIPKTKADSATATPQQQGTNPYLMDVKDYAKDFPKKAVQEFEKGVKSNGDNRKDEAIAHYRKAIEIAPDFQPAHNNLGTLYLGKSDFKSAEEQFREVVRLDQNDAQAYFNLSNVLMLTDRLPEAQTDVAAGLQRRPDSAFGNFLQGCLYGRTGKLAEAESSLQNALRLDAKMPQTYLQLVNLYLRQNRRGDAITQLQAFLKGFPDTAAAPKAQEILNKLQKEESAAKR
jgi:Tfp pilus assembly protein PilF